MDDSEDDEDGRGSAVGKGRQARTSMGEDEVSAINLSCHERIACRQFAMPNLRYISRALRRIRVISRHFFHTQGNRLHCQKVTCVLYGISFVYSDTRKNSQYWTRSTF